MEITLRSEYYGKDGRRYGTNEIENAYVTLSQAAPSLSKLFTLDLLQEQIKQGNNEARE
jgi:hypothetical protein